MKDFLNEGYDNLTLEYKIYNKMQLNSEEICELLNDEFDAEQDIELLKKKILKDYFYCYKMYAMYRVRDKIFIASYFDYNICKSFSNFILTETDI